jgi:hypothetical protein
LHLSNSNEESYLKRKDNGKMSKIKRRRRTTKKSIREISGSKRTWSTSSRRRKKQTARSWEVKEDEEGMKRGRGRPALRLG